MWRQTLLMVLQSVMQTGCEAMQDTEFLYGSFIHS